MYYHIGMTLSAETTNDIILAIGLSFKNKYEKSVIEKIGYVSSL
jgi:hypothetical protein